MVAHLSASILAASVSI